MLTFSRQAICACNSVPPNFTTTSHVVRQNDFLFQPDTCVFGSSESDLIVQTLENRSGIFLRLDQMACTYLGLTTSLLFVHPRRWLAGTPVRIHYHFHRTSLSAFASFLAQSISVLRLLRNCCSLDQDGKEPSVHDFSTRWESDYFSWMFERGKSGIIAVPQHRYTVSHPCNARVNILIEIE